MTTRFLRREKTVACPIHAAVRAETLARLNHNGIVRKADVIDALNFGAIEDAIRWDYIREQLQADYGCELVPLAESFFRRHAHNEEIVNPGKFLAQGYGKKTAGFAAVIPHNDHLVIERVKQRKARANGVQAAFDGYLQAINNKRGSSTLGPVNNAPLPPP